MIKRDIFASPNVSGRQRDSPVEFGTSGHFNFDVVAFQLWGYRDLTGMLEANILGDLDFSVLMTMLSCLYPSVSNVHKNSLESVVRGTV